MPRKRKSSSDIHKDDQEDDTIGFLPKVCQDLYAIDPMIKRLCDLVHCVESAERSFTQLHDEFKMFPTHFDAVQKEMFELMDVAHRELGELIASLFNNPKANG